MKKRQILSAVMGGVFMLSGISGILPLCTCSDAASSADMDIQDFPLSDVAMLDSYSTNAFSKELEYLLSFDTNRLLAGFRENAGMNTFGAKRYGGWENTNIAGHTVGHYLSAVAQAYQNPSITEKQRSELYGKITAIIDGMRECQKNSKGKTVNGETVDASRYLEYAEAFWDMVTTHHTYITGGNSEWEHFGQDDILDKERTNCNCETCNSYIMLKLSRELYKITGDSKYMDFYENAYYNSILSSQNPETGMTTYFQPMATGYFKVYSSQFDHFWCCTGSGMENFTKLGDTIYMHKDNTLYVNMYQSSILNWADENVTITQNSTIPDSTTSTFTIDGSGALDFRFRLPDWKADNVTIAPPIKS